MDDSSEKRRIPWLTRINIRPSTRENLRQIAKDERMTMASIIGIAVETYVTARSTS